MFYTQMDVILLTLIQSGNECSAYSEVIHNNSGEIISNRYPIPNSS